MNARLKLVMVVALAALLAGCKLASLMEGHGKQKAIFELPKDKRILVFVDLRSGIAAPPDFPAELGRRITNHLYKYHAAENFVGQERLTELRRNEAAFAKLGVGDVAQAVDADVVVYVDVVSLHVNSTSDKTVAEGAVQSLVKVIDRDGRRMWPASESTGALLAAQVAPAYTEQSSDTAVQKVLEDMLTVRVGRMFHPYSLDDKELTR